MLESFMEELLWKYPDDFFPNHRFKQFKRQYTLPSGGRFDLAFHDVNQTLWVTEVKAVPLRIQVVNQVREYAIELGKLHHQGPPPISMVVAPVISPPIRAQLDYWGVDYAEIHEAKFFSVSNMHGESEPEPPTQPTQEFARGGKTMSGAVGSQGQVQAAFLARVRNSYIQNNADQPPPSKETASFLLGRSDLRDIHIKWAFAYGRYRAEIQIYRKLPGGGLDTEFNARLFDELSLKKSEIEAAFGQRLRWNRDLGGGCGVVLDYQGGVSPELLEDPVRSAELVRWSTSQMRKLLDVVIPFIKALL